MTTTIYWPQDLPQEQFLDMTYEPQDARIQTQPELGGPKIRPRSLLSINHADLAAFFTGAQITSFNAFWQTTLRGGSLRFLWRDPTMDAAVEMSFRARPGWRPEVPDPNPAARLWRTTLSLRIHT